MEERSKMFKVQEKLFYDVDGLIEHGPINIVVFGDSVTHGSLNGWYDYETVYWNVLKQKINKIRTFMPVNMINAGIGGTSAFGSLKRMDSQVFSHNPDLIIVCFGLNDVNGELDSYLSSLRTIFQKCNDHKIDTIFMTPNMLNTYVADDTPKQYLAYASVTAEIQNSGRMDLYMKEAVKLAEEMDITVCDCYSKWKELSKTEDTTKLLINRINHPTQEMHKLFADCLYDTIFKNLQESQTEYDPKKVDSMYHEE